MASGRWLRPVLCLVALSTAPDCGGKAELDRARGGDGGSGGNGSSVTSGGGSSATSDGDSSSASVGGGRTTPPASTGGSGGALASLDEACPELAGEAFCGSESISGAEVRANDCAFHLDYDRERGAPVVAVDCMDVQRYGSGEGGAAGQSQNEVRWDWDLENDTATFLGRWCERIQAGAKRVDIIYGCSLLR